MLPKWKHKVVWLWALVLLPSSLGLWWAASAAQAQAPFTINYGEAKSGEVVDRLGDEWVFSGCLSDVVTITMHSAIFGSYLELYGPVGRSSLAEASVEGPNAAATIGGFVLPESGPFTVIAAGASIRDRGAYTLTLEAAGSITATSDQIVGIVGDGDTVTGSVETRLGEEWGFRGCLHDVVAVKVESDDFDPFVAVYPAGGASGGEASLVEMNGTDGVAIVEDLILPASGDYVVMAAGASIRDRGAYTLTFTVIDRARPTPTPTATPTGTITPAPTATATPLPPPTPTRSSGGSQQPLCVVVANLLNLRPGPGTDYAPPIGALERDAVLLPLNRNSNTSWIRVQVYPNGPTGWVSAAPQFIACNINITHLPLGVIPPTFTPTPTTQTTHTATVTPSYTPTPTGTYQTPTYTPSYTPTPTGTYETPTYTPTPTGTYETPTYTPTPTPTDNTTPTYTPTATPTENYTPTYTPTPTPTQPYGGGLPPTGYEVYPPVAQLGDLVGSIWVPENYGPAHEPSFHDWFYFEAYVYDPMVGNHLGAGIAYVDFTFYSESGGNPIYYRREQSARYCSFSGGEPNCNLAEIGQGAEWPGTNDGLMPGRYRVVIDAVPSNNGRSGAHWEMYFEIYSQNGAYLPLYAEIVQTGAGHNNNDVSGALVFHAVAYDPNVGNNDGDGIDHVLIQIYEGNQKVYERQENNAAYCAFSGGEPDCNVWYFHDNNNQWPSGEDIHTGQHTLRARVRAESGDEIVVERQIMISN